MLTIILGFLFFVLMLYIAIELVNEEALVIICTFLGVLVAFTTLLSGLFSPLQGMSDDLELVSTTELVTFSKSTVSEGQFYVNINDNNVYSYMYEVEDVYGEGEKCYREKTVSRNVSVVEKNCEEAVLKKYKRRPKRGIWTFAIGATTTEYVFVVPEGTVSRGN